MDLNKLPENVNWKALIITLIAWISGDGLIKLIVTRVVIYFFFHMAHMVEDDLNRSHANWAPTHCKCQPA